MTLAETDAQIAQAVQVLKRCAGDGAAPDEDIGGGELLYRAASNGDDEIALASLSGRSIGDADYTWVAFPLEVAERAH